MVGDLITGCLRLRRARTDDLDSVHAMLSDVKAMRYWSTPPHTCIGQSERWLQSMVDADPSVSDDFLVEKDGKVIGKLGCFTLPEIGFLLRSDQWGQGLAGEALGAFIARRRELGTPSHLFADVDPRNAASLGLLRKFNFIETGRATGTWRIGEDLCDSVYLKLSL